MQASRGIARGVSLSLTQLLSRGLLCMIFARASFGPQYQDSVCSGKSVAGFTNWVEYDPKSIYVDVDTSECGFLSTPIYVTSLAGDANHWKATGSSEIYTPRSNSFRTFLRYNDGITAAAANSYGWHVNWLADSLGSTALARGVCSGQTLNTDWTDDVLNTVAVAVDTSACGFAAAPVYVSSMVGAHSHYYATGSSELFTPSATGFTLYVHHSTGLTAALAQTRDYYITWLADDGVCSGQTPSGSTNWVDVDGGVYVDVDTSSCGFLVTPVYVTSMTGNSHTQTTGSSEVYWPTPTGFRTYILTSMETAATANSKLWQVNWIARPVTACTDPNGAAMSFIYPCACGAALCEDQQLCLALESQCQVCPSSYELTPEGCQYPLYHAASLYEGPCLQVLGHAVSVKASGAPVGLVYVLTVTLGALPDEFFEALGLAATAVDAAPSLESLDLQPDCQQEWEVTPGDAAINLTAGALSGPCAFTTSHSDGRVLRQSTLGVYLNSTDPDSGAAQLEKQWTVEVSLDFDAATTGMLGVSVRALHSGSGTLAAGSFSSSIELHRPEEHSHVLSQPHSLTIGDLRHVQQQLPSHLVLEVAMVYLLTPHAGGDGAAIVQNITEQVNRGTVGEGEAQFAFVPGGVSFASCTALHG